MDYSPQFAYLLPVFVTVPTPSFPRGLESFAACFNAGTTRGFISFGLTGQVRSGYPLQSDMWRPHLISQIGPKSFKWCRNLSTSRLENKSLLQVQGQLAAEFLQGLVTNDGRIVTDTFIYHLNASDSAEPRYLMELDTDCADFVASYFTKHNIRKKVKIAIDESMSVWIVMPPQNAPLSTLSEKKSWLPLNSDDSWSTGAESGLHFYAFDPRGIPGWSGRILLRSDVEASRIFTGAKSDPQTISFYNQIRWRLGIPEGSRELVRGKSLPLEANGDLSGALSFSKGCYVGQELTARTRFTGVVRRRYLPVRLTPVDGPLPDSSDNFDFFDSTISAEPLESEQKQEKLTRPVGWLRAIGSAYGKESQGDILEGLALLRLSEATASQSTLRVALGANKANQSPFWYRVEPFVPAWWPADIAPELARNVLP